MIIMGNVKIIYINPQGNVESPIYLSLSSKSIQSDINNIKKTTNTKNNRRKLSHYFNLYPLLTD